MTPIQYNSVLSNCRIESNRIEKSIRQRESNRMESIFFPTNRNALLERECSDHLQLIIIFHPAPPGSGLRRGEFFLASPYYSQRAMFASPLNTFFH